MISLFDLAAVLQTHWQAAAPGDIPTQFPGVPLDATRLRSWFEFWLTQAHEPPHRVPGAESLTILIDVHCYSRQAEKRTVYAMADQVRSALEHHNLPLSLSETPDITSNTLRIREAEIRDLTRESLQEPRLPVQHLVVSLKARAERSFASEQTEG